MNGPAKKNGPSSDTLRRAMGVAQHHDAVSGTSKQHVADDYAKRLAIGAVECQVCLKHCFCQCRQLLSFLFFIFFYFAKYFGMQLLLIGCFSYLLAIWDI